MHVLAAVVLGFVMAASPALAQSGPAPVGSGAPPLPGTSAAPAVPATPAVPRVRSLADTEVVGFLP